MPYVPTPAAIAIAAQLATNLATAGSPGPWTALRDGVPDPAGGPNIPVSSIPMEALIDALITGLGGGGGYGNVNLGTVSLPTNDIGGASSTITLFTISPAAEEAWTCFFYGHSRRTDTTPQGSSHFSYFLTIRRTNGVTTIVGSGQAPFANGGSFSSGLSFAVSGNDVLVQISGGPFQNRLHTVTGTATKG